MPFCQEGCNIFYLHPHTSYTYSHPTTTLGRALNITHDLQHAFPCWEISFCAIKFFAFECKNILTKWNNCGTIKTQ